MCGGPGCGSYRNSKAVLAPARVWGGRPCLTGANAPITHARARVATIHLEKSRRRLAARTSAPSSMNSCRSALNLSDLVVGDRVSQLRQLPVSRARGRSAAAGSRGRSCRPDPSLHVVHLHQVKNGRRWHGRRRWLRRWSGWTQLRIADHHGVSQQAVAKVLTTDDGFVASGNAALVWEAVATCAHRARRLCWAWQRPRRLRGRSRSGPSSSSVAARSHGR